MVNQKYPGSQNYTSYENPIYYYMIIITFTQSNGVNAQNVFRLFQCILQSFERQNSKHFGTGLVSVQEFTIIATS